MGWGQLNGKQTFNLTAKDVDRAIALAGLGRVESVLLERAREESWHEAVKTRRSRDDDWPDPIPARLNLYALAKETGIPREHLRSARKGLLASRIFLEAGGQAVWINKRADEWVHPTTGEPRLGPAALAYCAAARPKDQAPLPFPEGEMGMSRYPHGRDAVTSPSRDAVTSPSRDAVTSPSRDAVTSPSHIEDRACGDLIQTEEEGRKSKSPPPSSAPLGESPEATILAEIARDCLAWFPTQTAIASAVLDRQGQFEVAWYRSAAERLKAHPRDKHTRDYFLGILRSYATTGGPPATRNAKATPASPPTFVPTAEQLAARRRPGFKPERNGRP